MKLVALTYRQQAIATFLAALILVCLVSVGGLALLWTAGAEQREAVARADLLLARVERVGSPDPAREKNLLPGRSQAEAEAALQRALLAACEQHGARLDSVQRVGIERRGRLTVLRTRLALNLPEVALGPFLVTLATGAPLTAPETVEVAPLRPQQGSAGSPDGRLLLSLDLVSFSRLAFAGAQP